MCPWSRDSWQRVRPVAQQMENSAKAGIQCQAGLEPRQHADPQGMRGGRRGRGEPGIQGGRGEDWLPPRHWPCLKANYVKMHWDKVTSAAGSRWVMGEAGKERKKQVPRFRLVHALTHRQEGCKAGVSTPGSHARLVRSRNTRWAHMLLFVHTGTFMDAHTYRYMYTRTGDEHLWRYILTCVGHTSSCHSHTLMPVPSGQTFPLLDTLSWKSLRRCHAEETWRSSSLFSLLP